MSEAKRKVIDCRLHPSEKGCTVSIEGTEEEVLEAAAQHAVISHGHTESPELREQIRTIMKDAS
ncbi:MAG: DUF1059 domain-containing protein [Pyrinomonadaceae bacterium]